MITTILSLNGGLLTAILCIHNQYLVSIYSQITLSVCLSVCLSPRYILFRGLYISQHMGNRANYSNNYYLDQMTIFSLSFYRRYDSLEEELSLAITLAFHIFQQMKIAIHIFQQMKMTLGTSKSSFVFSIRYISLHIVPSSTFMSEAVQLKREDRQYR